MGLFADAAEQGCRTVGRSSAFGFFSIEEQGACSGIEMTASGNEHGFCHQRNLCWPATSWLLIL
jgi:hypothetical protein